MIDQARWRMNPAWRIFWTVAAAQVVAVVVASCVPDPAVVSDQADIAAWTADDGVCIKNGHTRAEIDACRDAMREFFCRPDGGVLVEAGACTNVTLSNGLRP